MSNLLRIVGCPGAGKTTELARQARKHAAHHGPSNVICVSLTRTAAAEIAGRDTGLPDEAAATLHGHARRAIEEHDGKAPQLAEAAASMREFHNAHPQYAGEATGDGEEMAVHGLHEAVAARRARMAPPEDWTDEEVDYWTAWDEFKRETGRTDFTDWIGRCVAEAIPPAGHPRVLLFDEAQDMSRLELALCTAWAAQADTAILAADTRQALFTWRGSDPDALERLTYAGVKTLDQSWRCPRAVAAVAKQWAGQLDGPAPDWKARDAEGSIDLAPYALRDTQEVAWAADKGEGTTMVLASCRYMLAPLTAELRAQGVPFHNPWRTEEAAWNPLAGPGASALRALLRPRRDCWGDEARMWTWADLETWTAPMLKGAMGRGARDLIKSKCLVDRFGESRAEETVDARALLDLGLEGALDVDRDEHCSWWLSTLTAAGHKQTAYATTVMRERGASALVATPRLTVGTVHSTKGSEASHCILAPDLSKRSYWSSWLTGDRDAIIRMSYVGMTRARERLTILEPGGTEHMPIADMIRGHARWDA